MCSFVENFFTRKGIATQRVHILFTVRAGKILLMYNISLKHNMFHITEESFDQNDYANSDDYRFVDQEILYVLMLLLINIIKNLTYTMKNFSYKLHSTYSELKPTYCQ
jgi:hypothetical protein